MVCWSLSTISGTHVVGANIGYLREPSAAQHTTAGLFSTLKRRPAACLWISPGHADLACYVRRVQYKSRGGHGPRRSRVEEWTLK